MENEKLIYAEKLKLAIRDDPEIDGQNFARMKKHIEEAPTVDAVEVEDPELLKAINLLIKQYEHSKASDYVHNPVAHAFYHTWKQIDESGHGGRKNNG